MAFLDLTAGPVQTEVVPVGQEVFWKASWSDAWEWVPYLQALSCSEGVGVNPGSASFRYVYGPIVRAESGGIGAQFNHYSLSGGYVMSAVYDRWGWAPLWIGLADVEHSRPRGGVVPAGEQRFTAYEMTHLLSKIPIVGSYTTAGFVNRPIVFNRRRSAGLGLHGNSFGPEILAHFSSRYGNVWTARMVLNYLIYYFFNRDEFGNLRPVQWTLAGDLALLEIFEDEWDLTGVNCLQALDRLIPRSRGLSFRPVVLEDGTVYLWVFNAFSEAIVAGDTFIPPNQFQTNIDYTGVRSFDAEIAINRMQEYDTLEVLGGYIYSCFSLSVADGTIEPSWGETSEDAYKAGSVRSEADAGDHDGARSSENFDDVYQRFDVNWEWDWFAGDGLGGAQYNAAPGVDEFGFIDPEILATVYGEDLRFERELPFDTTYDNFEGTRKLRPFVLVNIQDEIKDPEDEESTIMVDHWWYIDKMQAAERPAAQVDLANDRLAIYVRPPINHVAALNHFSVDDEGTEASNTTPVYDWQDYIATMNVRTDTRLNVKGRIPGRIPSEQGRKKVIDVPGAQAWYVVPGTVTRAVDGELVHHEGGLIRDDTVRLRRIGALAAWYYAQPRAPLRAEVKTITLAHPVGYLARAVFTAEGVTELRTPITRRTWQFGNGTGPQSTLIETSYVELDFVALEGDLQGNGAALDGRGAGSSAISGDFESLRVQQTQVPLRQSPGGLAYSNFEEVDELPPLPERGGRIVIWRSDGEGTGDGQMWGATRLSGWSPLMDYTKKDGTPGS